MREPIQKLTPQAAYRLEGGDYLLFEGQPGLVLVAGQQPDPKKRAYTWYFRHRDTEGRIARVKLGRWPAMSIADACSERERIDRERQRGVNHLDERRKAREAKRQAEAEQTFTRYTLKELAEDYLEAIALVRKPKSVYDVKQVLRPLIEGALSDTPVPEFGMKEATVMLHRIADRAPSMARTLRQEMGRAHGMAIVQGKVPESTPNPWALAKLDPTLTSKTKAKRETRFLNDAELASWLSWLPGSGMSELARDALHLTLLTGARSGEVIAMRKSDIADGKWTIKETKTDAPRTVVLSRQAKAIVERRSMREYLFPSPMGRHVAQKALVWQVAKFGSSSGLPSWSAHDLRRSARTGLSRIGCPTEIAEAAIGHTKAGIVGVYDLHKYEREVGEWLQKWADHLDALASPSVVPMRKKA